MIRKSNRASSRSDSSDTLEDIHEVTSDNIIDRRSSNAFWLIPYIAGSCFAKGLVISSKANLTIKIVCRDFYHSKGLLDYQSDECSVGAVEARVGIVVSLLTFTAGILSCITSAKLSSSSDKYGRKPILLLCHASSLISSTLYLYIFKYPVSPIFLFIPAIIDGITGSFTTINAVCSSYGLDCVDHARRGIILGYYYSCFFIGIATGPALAVKLTQIDSFVPFIFAFLLDVILCFYLILIPESMKKKEMLAAIHYQNSRFEEINETAYRTKSVKRNIQVLFGKLFASFNILKIDKYQPNAKRTMILLFIIDAVQSISLSVYPFLIYYPKFKFHWQENTQGAFLTMVGMIRAILLIVAMPLLQKVFATFHQHRNNIIDDEGNAGLDGSTKLEISIIRASLALEFGAYMLFYLSNSTSMFFVGAAINGLSSLGSPTIQSSLTKHVHSHKIGEALGALSQLQALSRVIMPVIVGALYAASAKAHSQLFFACIAAWYCIGFFLSCFLSPHAFQYPDTT